MTTVAKMECWAIVELMGHVKMAGLVTEEERFGAKMGRIDIPMEEGGLTTQYFGGGSVYRMTPTTEEVARAVAAKNKPAPIYAWELPKAALTAAPELRPNEELWDERDHSDQEDDDDNYRG
jgi:hypothetical protein